MDTYTQELEKQVKNGTMSLSDALKKAYVYGACDGGMDSEVLNWAMQQAQAWTQN